MADEQTIYLSPEEELTSVRERLEKTQARKIILVIPPQTQLRSHVGWRLIHARMRELGIELQVICPDRQVRAVARAAGFKVSETQESPSKSSRIGSTRPGSVNTRGVARSRIGNSKAGQPEPPTRRRFTPSTNNRPSAAGRADYEDEATLERLDRKEGGADKSQQVVSPALPEPAEPRFSPAFGFHISTTPSVRPSVSRPDEDDDTFQIHYEDDYNRVQQIRQAAREGRPPSDKLKKQNQAASQWGNDPFAYMHDEQPPTNLPEQRGSAPDTLEELESAIPDISDRSTEIMQSEIEDLGDLGNIVFPENDTTRRRNEPGARPRTGSGQISPAPLSGKIPATPRRSPRAPRPGAQEFDEDDDMLALPEGRAPGPVSPSGSSRGLASNNSTGRSSRGLAGTGQTGRQSRGFAGADSTGRPSRGLAGNDPGGPPSRGFAGTAQPAGRGASAGLPSRKAYSQPIRQEPASQASPAQRPSYASQRPSSRQVMPSSPRPSRRPVAAPAPRRRPGGNRGLLILVTVIVILLVGAAGLFYFVPTAQVTLILQAKAFNQPVQLNATTDPQAHLTNKVAAQMLTQTFTVSGQGTASGTTRVGNASAQGIVAFTNNGTDNIIIPTHTVINTPDGIQFLTGGQVLVPANSTFFGATVSAALAGEAGNVPANSITSIPASSLDSIAQYNHLKATNINLTVTNDKPTTGGGATTVLAVTRANRDALTLTLHQKLQQQIKSWLAAQIHHGDQQGRLMPDVLNSASPLQEEQLSGAPAAGQADPVGTFSGSISLAVKTLVARSADLQAAAGAQINATVAKQHPAATLPDHAQVTLNNIKSTASADGTALAISATASSQIIAQVNIQDISAKLAGKGTAEAITDLKSGAFTNSAPVKDVQISISPGFLPTLPMLADHIHIILQALQAKA